MTSISVDDSELSPYPWTKIQPLTSQLVLLKQQFPYLELPPEDPLAKFDSDPWPLPTGFEGWILFPSFLSLAKGYDVPSIPSFNAAMVMVLRAMRRVFQQVKNHAKLGRKKDALTSESGLMSDQLRLTKNGENFASLIGKHSYMIVPIQFGAKFADFSPYEVDASKADNEFCLDLCYGSLALIYQSQLFNDHPILHMACQGSEYAFNPNRDNPELSKFSDTARISVQHRRVAIDWNFGARDERDFFMIPTVGTPLIFF